MKKRIVSMVLTVAMLASMLSLGMISAYAVDPSDSGAITDIALSATRGTVTAEITGALSASTVSIVACSKSNGDYAGYDDKDGFPASQGSDDYEFHLGDTLDSNKKKSYSITVPAADYNTSGVTVAVYVMADTDAANVYVATIDLDTNGNEVQPLAYAGGEVTLTVGVASNKSVPAATGGAGSYKYSTSSTLPSGLTALNEDGTISGTPTTAGDTTISVKVESGAETQTADVTIKVGKGTYAKPSVTPTATTAADATDGKITIASPITGATYEISSDGGKSYTDADVKDGVISDLAAGSYSVRVKGDANYNESDPATVTVTAPGAPVATITDLAKTYNGQVQKATVKVTVDGADKTSEYTITYTNEDGDEVDPKEAGSYTVTVTKDAKEIGTETLVIAPAEPTAPEFADEIIVDETTLGDVMQNGELELDGVNGEKVTGTFTWLGDVTDDTPIVPGTKYQWKFETDNTNYLGLTGEISWVLEDDRHEAIMLGRANTTLFGPDDNLNRAEAATILSRLYGMYTEEEIFDEAAVQHAPVGLTDVSDASIWYYAAVGFAQNKNLIEGKTSTSFAPIDNITRAEFATMLARLVAGTKDVPEADVSQSKLTGISGHWAENAIVYLELNKGGLNGKVGTDFKPNDNLTRAEAAKMVNAVFGRLQSTSIAEEDQLDADLNIFTDVYRNTWYYNNVIEATVGHEVSDPDFRHVK